MRSGKKGCAVKGNKTRNELRSEEEESGGQGKQKNNKVI